MAFSWTQCVYLMALCITLVTATIQTPDKDAFYAAPHNVQSLAPGTIIRTRGVQTSFLGVIPNLSVKSYQLLYRTTATNGSAIASATTVFMPLVAMKDRFVSFHTAYDGSSPLCSPSYTYQLGAAQAGLITEAELLFLESFVASGYIVSSPDYESEDAAFGAGRLAGMVALDSMRAVSSFRTAGFTTPTPRIVGYGYSGGSLPTGWAASLQRKYAPELPVVGWASGGTVANLTGTALYLDNTLFSGFLPPAIDGLMKPSSYQTELAPRIASIITPYGQQVLDFAKEHCIADLFNFAEMSMQTTAITSLGDRVFYDPVIHDVLSRITMGVSPDESPIAPMYIFHALPDEVIPYANASSLVDAWCADGVTVDFLTYQNGGHADTVSRPPLLSHPFSLSAHADLSKLGTRWLSRRI
jgi:hypothetical protein